MKEYIRKYILCRYDGERNGEPIPTPFTFVFGHTHRHFDGRTVDIDGRHYGLANTGGWLREDKEEGEKARIMVIDPEKHEWESFA